MTKFKDKLDLQIKLHLAVRHLLTIVVYHYGKVPISKRLEEWYKLSWNEFSEELKSAGISLNSRAEELFLMETFEEQKKRVLFIEDELARHAEIVSNNTVRI